MNPTAAHMLAHAIEDDRRRDLRRQQLARAAHGGNSVEARSWFHRIRLPRLRLAPFGSRA